MSSHHIEDALENCLVQLERGNITLDACLAQYPDYAEELRPLLQMALSLRDSVPAVATPQQVHSIEQRVLQSRRPSTRPISFYRRPSMLRVAAAGFLMFILAGVLYILTQAESPTRITGTAGDHSGQDALPITIQLSGTLVASENNDFFLDDVPLDFGEHGPPAANTLIRVEGQLLDSGTILVESWQESNQSTTNASCPAEPCYPILSILSASYDLDYAELESYLSEDLAIGELARLVAIAHHTDANLDDLIEQRREDTSWQDILAPYPEIPPIHLSPTS